MSHDCERFREQLMSMVSDGSAIARDVITDARGCVECAAILHQLAVVVTPAAMIAPGPDTELRAIVGGRRSARQVWTIRRATNFAIGLALATAWMVAFEWHYRMIGRFGVFTPAVALRAIVISLGVIGGVYLSVRGVMRDGRRVRLFSRWNGRQLQGICVGIGELFGISAWIVRALFVALLVTGLGGGTIYCLLAFVVMWHPDDAARLGWWRHRVGRRRAR